jgi:hypothetical protein
MARYQYTVSVLVAGMMIAPALDIAGGLMGNLFIVAAIAVWNMIYPVLPPCCKHAYPGRTEDGDYKIDKIELSRLAFGANIQRHTYASLGSIKKSGSRRSAMFFGKSTSRLSSVCATSSAGTTSGINRLRTTLSYFETVGEHSDHVNVHEEMPFGRRLTFRNLPNPEIAEVEPEVREMFAKLCDDADVGMTHEDMEKLLAVWGLPYTEAEYVFAELRPKLSNANVISFDEFYRLLEPVWRYTLDVVTTEATGAFGKTLSVNDTCEEGPRERKLVRLNQEPIPEE